MIGSHTNASSPLAVLHLGEVGVEFLDRSGRFHRFELELEPGAGAASQAAECLRSVGVQPGSCILALSAPFVTERTISLAEVPAKELRTVLARKAATLLETEIESAFFAAQELIHEAGEKERRWLLHAVQRSKYLSLRYALRDQGFEVKDVVTERMSLASHVISELDDAEDEATVCVALESKCAAVHLAHAGELVHQTILKTRFEDGTAMAKVLVQELRGIDAFWRRKSRGGAVRRLALFGFPPDWAERLELTARAVLPGVEFLEVPGSTTDDLAGARSAALHACRSTSKLQVSLDLPLRPRRRAMVAAGLASVAVAFLGVLGSLHRVGQERERFGLERDALVSRAEGIEELRTRRDKVTGALGGLALERARIERLAESGLPMDEILRETLTAFAGQGALLTLSVGEGAGGRELNVSGLVPARPVETQRAIDAVLERAARSTYLRGLEVDTPAVAGTTSRMIEFSAQATIGGAE